MRLLSDTTRTALLTVLTIVLLFGLFFAPDVEMANHLVHLTRSACLLYRPWLIAVYAAADGATFLAYVSISLTLFVLARGRRAQKGVHFNIARWVLTWMALFVFFCAINHLFDLLLLRYPIYEEFAFVKAALAAVSAYTALFVIREIETVIVLPKGVARRSAEELFALVNTPTTSTQDQIAILRRAIAVLSPGLAQQPDSHDD